MGHFINGNVDKALESFHTAFTLLEKEGVHIC